MGRLTTAFAARFHNSNGSLAWALALRRLASDYAGKVPALVLIPILLITGGLAAGPETFNRPTINGKWKFNLRNSNMGNMPAPQRATLIVSANGNKLMWRETGLAEDGRPFDYLFDGSIDGKPYPLKGARWRVTVAFQRGKGTIVGKWKGKGKRLSMTKVSADGKSLTVENVSNVYNMVANWTTAWDRVPDN
jgi:hypothetical protein